MTLREFFGRSRDTAEETSSSSSNSSSEPVPKLPDFIEGKIYYINDEKGFGFISSKAIPFKRIFFHWQDLRNDTLDFTRLRKGMSVNFKPIFREDKESYRAIQIRVLSGNGDSD